MDRRGFLKLMGVASGASVLAGCNLDRKSEKLIPYLVPPEDGVLPGEHTFVATSCSECPAACGLSARVIEDRPVKVDGLEAHPVNQGALCMRGQASINRLYLPERLRGPRVRNESGELVEATWDDALARVTAALGTGKSALWSKRTTGSLAALGGEFCDRLGAERLPEFEVFSRSAIRRANQETFGRAEVPWYDIAAADFLLTVGADVVGTFENPNANVAAITDKRDEEARFAWFHAESHATLSGFQANTRLAVRPGSEAHLLAFLLHEYRSRRILADRRLDGRIAAIPEVDAASASRATGLDAAALESLITAFVGAEHPLVIAGEVATSGGQALEVARLAALLQAAAGMVGSTIDFTRSPDYSRVGSMADAAGVVERLEGGEIDVLFVLGIDPVGLVAGAGNIGAAIEKPGLTVGIGYVLDDTMARCDVVLPHSHALESWGDAEPRRGLLNVIQPTFEPIYDTRSDGDILLSILTAAGRGLSAASYQEYVMARWNRLGGGVSQQLVDNGFAVTSSGGSQPGFSPSGSPSWSFPSRRLSGAVVTLAPSHRWYDGRSADLPLLHEVPDPLSSVSWDDWVSVSPETARDLGVDDKHEVELSGKGWSLRLPVRVQPQMSADVWMIQRGGATVPAGWSRDTGEVNAYVDGVTVRATSNILAMAVLSGSLGEKGRGVVPGHEVYHFAPELEEQAEHGEHPPHDEVSFYKEPKFVDYRWSMAVDMDLCVGCGACVAACYVENNVPMTGREEHVKGREMSWIRIEPYYSEDHADFVPMMCQHCDYAPCEPVCPVFAAYTNEQGLAVQVYNRCVGTRYCSNNCPYKQRRFNWFAWNERPEPLDKMVNPDVSLRGKGIMEKCSMCYQRIRRARDTAKDEDRKIQEGDVQTACQQACPGNAIVFGNLLDENSEVSRWARSERSTRVLSELGTSPGVFYLSRRLEGKRHQREEMNENHEETNHG